MTMKKFINEIRNTMLEDKTISIKFFGDELAFYLFEKEIGIYLNKYNYGYRPYIDFEGYLGETAMLGIEELKIIYDIMTIIENNLGEVLSWIDPK